MGGMEEAISILCVDDEPNVLSALRRLFMDEDYTILTAPSGREGIGILEKEHVQIVISDYRMPGMSGVEFLTEVYRRWPNTVRIVLSGYADTASIVEAINEGHIYKFIPKPWNDAELKVTISNSIERYFLFKRNLELTGELRTKNDELEKLNSELARLLEEKVLNLSFRDMILKAHGNIVDSLPVGILGIDRSGLIAVCNATCSGILGQIPDIIGTNIQQVGNAQLQDLAARVFEEGQITQDLKVGEERYRVLASLIDPKSGQEGATLTFIHECHCR
ncbi:MAG: response regulator [Nitrospiraceae bacterium]|nr:response regulator [Nitrospiraceae bacterium]